jgi:hypothetical protein
MLVAYRCSRIIERLHPAKPGAQPQREVRAKWLAKNDVSEIFLPDRLKNAANGTQSVPATLRRRARDDRRVVAAEAVVHQQLNAFQFKMIQPDVWSIFADV